MRICSLLSAAVVTAICAAAAPALADALHANGFPYDDISVTGIVNGRLQTVINGKDTAFDLDKVESIELTNQPKFNEAEKSRKDAKSAANPYKAAIKNIDDAKLKIVAKLRAVGPLDADGQFSEAVTDFLDAYAASPTDSVWKLHPTNLPAPSSTMLKDAAAQINAKLPAFKVQDAIKNVKTLELDILNKAGDPRAAALASELGTGAPAPAAIGNGTGSTPAVVPGQPATGNPTKNPDAAVSGADTQLQKSITPEAAIQLFETKAKALEAEHKTEEAAATWIRIEAHYPGSVQAPNALLQAADLQKSAKHDDEARRLYQEIVDKYPNSASAVRATAALKAK